MGLTNISSKKDLMKDIFDVENGHKKVIALTGNPNTGKSSIFNTLTGLHQHTGNWSGKTVVNAYGEFKHKDVDYGIIDLPGIYSLFSCSQEEEVTREFISFAKHDVLVVVCDMTCIERNLNVFFQVLELNNKVILCLNLYDEARDKNIEVNVKGLEKELGVPVVVTSTKEIIGIEDLKNTIEKVVNDQYDFQVKDIEYDEEIEEKLLEIQGKLDFLNTSINKRWISLRILDSDEKFFNFMENHLQNQEYEQLEILRRKFYNEKNRESIVQTIYEKCKKIRSKYVSQKGNKHLRDVKIDNIITSKKYGIPIMLGILALVLFITISFANIPSSMLSNMFTFLEGKLSSLLMYLKFPSFLHDMIVFGLFRVTGWVISVMLPPMAIFFPMFTFLEDLGYLPRVAFNMDHMFKKSGCHGKQCLTMCMGFGCNCAGVIGTRIIESKRERLIAIITNNFVPCNGRFPTIIVLSSIFFSVTTSGLFNSIITALVVTAIVIFGVAVTLLISFILSKTLLKGQPSSFTLELPPYRKPRIKTILYTSLIDRTMFVLGRAVMVAAPFGVIIWILANIYINGVSIVGYLIGFLNPIGKLIGLDGTILSAFILGLPANEIVMPILLMNYLSTGKLVDFDTVNSLGIILRSNGWTIITAINTMLFSLLHFPCSTALWTIRKETGSRKWTFIAFIIPTIVAFVVCFITNIILRLILRV